MNYFIDYTDKLLTTLTGWNEMNLPPTENF